MAVRRNHSDRSKNAFLLRKNSAKHQQSRRLLRRNLLEALESRQLMAFGPQLIGIQPNNSDLLEAGDVRQVAPRELVFRFDDSQVIDASTLSGIRITRSGGDGTFGLASGSSDFGSGGRVDILLTALSTGSSFEVRSVAQNLGAGAAPVLTISGNIIQITLNNHPSSPTTGQGLVDAINASSSVGSRIRASIRGGLSTAPLASQSGAIPVVRLLGTQDVPVPAGAILVGDRPNENEVTFRFAENLPDDFYRIEVFGFDDPARGIVGLRSVSTVPGRQGELFVPSDPNSRQDTIDFRLDLGPQVTGVVPQPVYREAGVLKQARDTVVVHFDNDKLLVENDAFGQPTSRSVENPEFYQLIYTADTVRNTDDAVYLPLTARYDAVANTVTLRFANDIDRLPGSNAGQASFRLRIGTRETAPLAPVRSEAAATAISDLNTAGAARVRFTSRALGENGSGVKVEFVNSMLGGDPVVTASGETVSVDLRSGTTTVQQVVTALQLSSASASLLAAELEPGSNPAAVVGSRPINYSPITLYGVGSTFDTATNLGTIGSAVQSQSSLILSSAIDPVEEKLDNLGASDDPGHRQLAEEVGDGYAQHINDDFGADRTAGVKTVFYNFKTIYSNDTNGNPLVNAITDKQKQRARESLSMWANYLGVQFVETPDQGITIATGSFSGLQQVSGTRVRTESQVSFGVRIDPTFQSSMLVMQASRVWNDNYGEDWSRTSAAAFGMLLGLEHAGELDNSSLMRLSPSFLNANADGVNDFEPIFPSNPDVLHGQFLHRTDSNDVDLYRFDVDFGNDDRVGLFVAETFAERLGQSSEADTLLQLYKNTYASATSNFGADKGLQIRLESTQPGKLGNNLRLFVTKSDRGVGAGTIINVFDNLVTVDLNSNSGSETTAQQLVDSLNADAAVRQYFKATLLQGSPSTKLGNRDLTYSPIVLQGGGMELVAQNDDYFSEDSYLKANLGSGIYYIGVSSTGNNKYDGVLDGTGSGGRTQGNYELRLTFRAQVDTVDAIQDIAGSRAEDLSVTFDGDGDGIPGGTYDFWFQTRPLNRVLEFTAGAYAGLEGKTITVTGATGVIRRFEFSSDASVAIGNIAIPYTSSSTQGALANALAAAINSQSVLGVSALANGAKMVLTGERTVQTSPGLLGLEIQGRTIFVDKAAGPNADGSLLRPFNNIAGAGVPNAFAAAQPGDIVRIVGNGGGDGRLETTSDNFAYEIGLGLLPGSVLSDGTAMEVPKGVTAMIDAGAILKLRRAYIGVGSTTLGVDRSGSSLQVLGTPNLTDQRGALVRDTNGNAAGGSVVFTSWLDETVGLDNYQPTTTPAPGDWGGISFLSDLDRASGREDLENEGIFLRYVNQADLRFGGGSVVINSVQKVVNPVEMFDVRPTITFNKISRSADAALSASPDAFEETNFHEPRYQVNGAFTSDFDRVGPRIHHNQLTGNSVNGLFVRVPTQAGESTRPLSVAGRFDDTDITHVISENILINGTPGGALLDTTIPSNSLFAMSPATGGDMVPGTYNYKLSFIDRFGYETPPSDVSSDITLIAGQTAIQFTGLPSVSGDYVQRRLYRSNNIGVGPYDLIAVLNANDNSYLDLGGSLGGRLLRDRPTVSDVLLSSGGAGSLAAGSYTYRIVMIDQAGRESLASNATASRTVGANGSIIISNIPLTQEGYAGRRIYRSAPGGSGPFVLVAQWMDSNQAFLSQLTDRGSNLGTTLAPTSLGNLRARLDASLVVDPGTVVKMEGARFEVGFGAQMLAEGTDGLPVVFTSKLDDRYGAGGAFDTNNDGSQTTPQPRDWGGIYVAGTSNLSLDYGVVAHAGGVTRLEGTFRAFNPIELQQASARIAHTLFINNANGVGGQGPADRLGRLTNKEATIFARGTQPVILENTFINNRGSAITIDANSLMEVELPDPGRMTGSAGRADQYSTNRGPLIRGNRLFNNQLNGLEIRGERLNTAGAWDDTDLVHVLFDSVIVDNLHHVGGLKLFSSPTESLVVKLAGSGSNFDNNAGTGLTARGTRTNISDRVGGTLEIIGQPGFPVVLTSLKDDTVGAGLQPDGRPQTDTNNDGIASIPVAGDWRSVLLDQYSHDRNVSTVLEAESIKAIAPGPNGTVNSAQFLGNLAASPSNSDENLRLGFVIQGVISQTDDVDIYSFTAEAGTEVWLDIDRTSKELDVVIEVLNANGELLARSDNSFDETIDPSQLVVGSLVDPNLVNIMPTRTQGQLRTNASGLIKDDYSFNMKDAGLRMVLPGAVGVRSTYVFRVRSASLNADQSGAGLTKGTYQVQVRTREADEFAASTVQYSDIRYATNGVHMRGLPLHSPLLGEVQEDESARSTSAALANNDNPSVGANPGSRPQYVGNLLQSDMGAISIGGRLSSAADVDFYRFELTEGRLVSSGSNPIFHSVVFDMDYADGLNRADTSLALYRVTGFGTSETYELIHIGEDSNITDDRRRPQALQDLDDLSRGSVGAKDPFIGPVALASGTYLLAVTSAARTPAALANANVRRAPVPSVKRIAEDSLESLPLQTGAAPSLPQLFDRTFTGGTDPRNLWHLSNAQAGVAGHRGSQSFAFATSASKSISQLGGAVGDLVSNAFNLGGYSASDLPVLYFNYQLSSDTNDVFDVLVRRSNGTETVVATNRTPTPSTAIGLTSGGQWLQARVDLSSFAGQDGLRLVYRYNTVGDNAEGTGVHVDDFVIGFAERGEIITNTLSDATFNTRSTPIGSVLTGEYQVEIRKAEDFFTSTLLSGLTLEKAWDTNDRFAQQTTLVAPEGRLLRDGDTFDLSDGSTKITFEFTTDNVVGLGNVQIRFLPTDSATVVARAIRDAINNPSVQSRLKVQAASTGGIASGNIGGDARIDLLGRASGDFRVFQPQSLLIRSQTNNPVTLRNEILGTGLTATNTVAPGYTGGTQSAALATFNGVDGILLSTGNVAGARGPNTSDRTSGISSNTGDAMTNAALGVTTTDSTVLEFTFQFGNGNQGGDLYLDLIFASEEYNEFLGRDAVAVFIDGVNYAVVPGTSSRIGTGTINGGNPLGQGATNPQLFVNNDPNDAGVALQGIGFDGYTLPLTIEALGLGAGEHTIRIVVADTSDNGGDSALFIASRSMSTTKSVRTWNGLEAIYHTGKSDQNVNRDQGLVIVQNNFIRHARDYGVWSDAGDRLQDPRDVVTGTVAAMMQNLPPLVGTGTGAVRNLRELNNKLVGGFAPGVVIQNNVLESGGLGGVHVQGENPIWMITPTRIGANEPPPTLVENAEGDQFGWFIDDGDVMVIDSGRMRARMEFEDIAGGQNPGNGTYGSGVVGGNGWRDTSTPVYYRESTGSQYLRFPNTVFGSTAMEVMQSLRDSILGSILVTNGTTQNVRATVAPSLLAPLTGASQIASAGYPNYYNRPAVYLEGVTNIYWEPQVGGRPFDIRRVDVAEGAQPFVRIVNNTVYGSDGRASFNGGSPVAEPNDTISTSVQTWQGTAHNPIAYTANGVIGDSSQFRASATHDVDVYQFKLDVGDRVRIDIDSAGPLDSVLRIFNSQGIAQTFRDSRGNLVTISNNDPAPGEAPSNDPYIDFTATQPGVYYVGVSSSGNNSYDPLSLGNRTNGNSTGAYAINLQVMHPQKFTITVEDFSQYQIGDTFTIGQVADFASGTNEVTFELVNGNAPQPGNIPIAINNEYRAPDIARAIALAINAGNGGNPVLPNIQNIPNGNFGLASPIGAVSAIALGGISGVQGGLPLFGRRIDGSFPTHSGLGIGHDRTASGQLSSTSLGDGTTERFVVISNAAYIRGNGAFLVDPDFNEGNNLDQLYPESGILVSEGASPTILNNVFVNVQTPVVDAESRTVNGISAPFGTNALNDPKPGEVILSGSIYQFTESGIAANRLSQGIETNPTNIPNTGLDFNTTVPGSTRVFVNAQGSQFLPARFSPVIDSSIDSLQERESFRTIKQAMGISNSPILAPERDAAGLLRVDDPEVSTPSGLGADVFKDRGALDRPEAVGPTAHLVIPVDNDSAGNDRDRAESYVELTQGVVREFRIQLKGPNLTELLVPSRSVTLFEDGRLLREGIDYVYAFNETTNEIILTPLAGVWRQGRVYEISLNNKDRFVLEAPRGDQIEDGDQFTITDDANGIVYFEFDSGYQMQLPRGLQMTVPLAGGAAGGLSDGDRFSIDDGRGEIFFELDRNGTVLAGNIAIPFTSSDTREIIAQKIVDAIAGSSARVTPRLLPGGVVYLGSVANVRLNTTFSSLSQPNATWGLKVPALGARPGGITDGQMFSLTDGLTTITFEFDTDGVISNGTTIIDTSAASTATDVAVQMLQAIQRSPLKVQAQLIGSDVVYLGLPANGDALIMSSRLALVGVSRTISDGQSFSITYAGVTKTFEYTTDSSVAAGRIPIPFTVTETQDEIGTRTAQIIRDANLDLDPLHLSNGNISLGGTVDHQVSVALAPSIGLSGTPGVAPKTTLEVVGSLVLQVPIRGGQDVVDDSFFRITANGVTVTYEFDRNSSGPTVPGNVVIPYGSTSSANDIATSMAIAIRNSLPSINAQNIGAGRVDLGLLPDSAVSVGNSALSKRRGNVSDGEFFTITNGTTSVTFEFDNVSVGNGFVAGRTPILFSNNSTREEVVAAMKAAIEGSALGLQTEILAGTQLRLLDNPRSTTDITRAPSLGKSGVPGGANAVRFAQDANFTSDLVADQIYRAINSASNTTLQAKKRGGNTLFLEHAITVSPEISSFFIRAIEDLAGNDLQANRINDETQFTILMPGALLDYGDAPDPFSTTLGRYPTLHDNNGARHVVSSRGLFLGATISGDEDGNPTPTADGDASDDGVSFTSERNPTGLFNRHVFTDITVTLSAPGFVDAWVDFSGDGDWDDPGEKILNGVEFFGDSLTQTFAVQIPPTAPEAIAKTQSFARFRASGVGGLLPTGLAVDGEVEDYAVILVPGTPPIAVNDQYVINEDESLVTYDATGQDTPNFPIDDGVAANDEDADGDTLSVTLVEGPKYAQSFTLNPDGTFSYTPLPDFFGVDSFTYRVRDAELTSNNIATAVITIREVNDEPIGGDDSYIVDEDNTQRWNHSQLLLNDLPGPPNESNQALKIVGVSAVSARGGSVMLSGTEVIYTPPSDYSGPDSFTYTIEDNGTTSGTPDFRQAVATVNLTVRDVNDPPIAETDFLETLEDVAITRSKDFFLLNDRPGGPNESWQTLKFLGVEPASTAGGSVVFNGTNVTYTPRKDFVGTDTFFYLIEDNGTSEGRPDPKQARGTVSVTVVPINDAPSVILPLGTLNVLEDAPDRVIELLNHFFDPDIATNGDELRFEVVSNSKPSVVVASIVGSQLTLRFLPDQNGTANILIRATDKAGESVSNLLTVIVAPVDDAPIVSVAIPDQQVNEDSPPISIDLSNHFTDADIATNNDVLTYSVVSNSNSSLVTTALTGSVLTLSFAPDASGRATITVRATDKRGFSVTDTFDVVVLSVNDPPRTQPDFYNAPQGGTITTTDATGNATPTIVDNGVLANDSDPEGDAFTAELVRQPTRGTVVLNPNGTFTYNALGSSGETDTFTYRALDARGAVSVETLVSIRIGPPLPPRHQNPLEARDVNADGFVSPIDALLVINLLNAQGPSVPVSTLPDPPPYRDVNGDNLITPLDAILVINFLNGGSGEGEGEGESTGQISGSAEAMGVGIGWQSTVSRVAENSVLSLDRPVATSAMTGPRRQAAPQELALASYLASWKAQENDPLETSIDTIVDGTTLEESLLVDELLKDWMD